MDEKKFNEVFSSNLRYYLSYRGKTQADLAKYVGVSTAAVNTWCKGLKNPRMDKTDKICQFLMVKRSDLIEERKDDAPSLAPPVLSDEAKAIGRAYDRANEGIKDSVAKLLDVKREDSTDMEMRDSA